MFFPFLVSLVFSKFVLQDWSGFLSSFFFSYSSWTLMNLLVMGMCYISIHAWYNSFKPTRGLTPVLFFYRKLMQYWERSYQQKMKRKFWRNLRILKLRSVYFKFLLLLFCFSKGYNYQKFLQYLSLHDHFMDRGIPGFFPLLVPYDKWYAIKLGARKLFDVLQKSCQ